MGALQELRLAGERRLTFPVVFDDENRLVRADAICAVQASKKPRSIAAAATSEAPTRWIYIRAALRLNEDRSLRAWGLSKGLLLA